MILLLRRRQPLATKFAILAHNKVSTLERYNFLVKQAINLEFEYDINYVSAVFQQVSSQLAS